ncbi:hypothetical protein MA16_Dca023903 [Dendrobium catenatum]|uniref:Uncharacterized protein n=1 Tax=Dendrobium catenatum TaxID=906689 RepID=A0A2I0WYJ0_9ASPA|nr:hypothetical protein MA16_Dca023903 [Dendrobium catenatum]
MVATSILNCFSPCSIPSSCFTATSVLFARAPLYTAPNPPEPSFSLKPFVVRCNSLYENCTGAPDAYSKSAYCIEERPNLGPFMQKNQQNPTSIATRPRIAPTTTTTTTHVFNLDELDLNCVEPANGVNGSAGEQTLTKEVLGKEGD